MRRLPNMTERLACMVAIHLGLDRERLKGMTAKQVCALVQWDHYPVAYHLARDLGWSEEKTHHPSNLQPLGKAEHGAKSRSIDTPAAAKGKRLEASHAEYRKRMLAKAGRGEPEGEKTKGRLRSRGFQGHRKFNGEIVRK